MGNGVTFAEIILWKKVGNNSLSFIMLKFKKITEKWTNIDNYDSFSNRMCRNIQANILFFVYKK